MKKIIIYSIVVVVSILVSFVLLMKWAFWEPNGMKKGSMVYMLKVPDELKAFPIWGELTAPEYNISLPDSSVGPIASWMKYTTSLTLYKVMDEAIKLQFSCRIYTPGRAQCEKIINESQLIQLSYGKILSNRDENIEVAFLKWE